MHIVIIYISFANIVNIMSFYSTLRRQWFSFSYGKSFRSKRLILFIGILFLGIFLLIFIGRKETCWSKTNYFHFFFFF